MSAVRSKSAVVVKEEAQSRPARGGQVLACEPVEQVLVLECNIFQVSGIRYLPSIRSKSDLFTASMVPLLALIPYHFSSGEKKYSGRRKTSFPRSLSISRKKDFIQWSRSSAFSRVLNAVIRTW